MDETTGNKLWVEHWQRVGPILEKVRHDELRAMTDEQAARAFTSLCEFALSFKHRHARATSGFVDQQRLFLKLRQHDPAP